MVADIAKAVGCIKPDLPPGDDIGCFCGRAFAKEFLRFGKRTAFRAKGDQTQLIAIQLAEQRNA
ncbi:hypothetical protein D3C87_1622950 [compost metagenome]